MLRLAAPLVLPYSADQWAQFIAQHSLGAFALAWVAGITFMLTMTITVLQLREVRAVNYDCVCLIDGRPRPRRCAEWFLMDSLVQFYQCFAIRRCIFYLQPTLICW